MILKHTFPATTADYHGFVSPRSMMQEINEGVAAANYADGVGFSHIYPTIGVTWMMGQCVLEFDELLPCNAEVEIETLGHEQHGIATVRRCVMRREGRRVMRFASKLVPVDFKARKAVPASVLDPFWKTPADPCGERIKFLTMPDEMETVEDYPVCYRDCDTNKHMTAFRYLDLIMEAVGYWDGEAHMPERIQIDYMKECTPGDRLLVQHALCDGIHYCRGVKSDGNVSFHASVKLAEQAHSPADMSKV